MQEQRHVKHTYDKDFECLEVNEADLNLLSDNDIASMNGSQEADAAVSIDESNKKMRRRNMSPAAADALSKPSVKAAEEK